MFTYACTGYGAVRDQPSRLVSLFCVWGAAGGITKKVKNLPNPRSRRTRLSADLPGARAERVPSTSALPLSHSVGLCRPGVSLPSRASPGVNPSSGLHPRENPSSGLLPLKGCIHHPVDTQGDPSSGYPLFGTNQCRNSSPLKSVRKELTGKNRTSPNRCWSPRTEPDSRGCIGPNRITMLHRPDPESMPLPTKSRGTRRAPAKLEKLR